MFKPNRKYALGILAMSITLGACSGQQEIKEGLDGEVDFAKVTVRRPSVGTRIRRHDDPEGKSVPVRVFDSDDMRSNGARSVGGFLGGKNR